MECRGPPSAMCLPCLPALTPYSSLQDKRPDVQSIQLHYISIISQPLTTILLRHVLSCILHSVRITTSVLCWMC